MPFAVLEEEQLLTNLIFYLYELFRKPSFGHCMGGMSFYAPGGRPFAL